MLSPLYVYRKTTTVVVDEDPAMYALWEKRLKAATVPEDQVNIQCVTSIEALLELIMKHPLANFSYLIGDLFLDYVDRLDIVNQTTLLVSNDMLVKKAAEKKINYLLKKDAAIVPITITGQLLDCVLLDDNEMILSLWEKDAETAGKRLACFSSVSALFDYVQTLHRSMPIYVDHDLSDQRTGFDVCKQLHKMGFRNLHVTTAYGDDYFEKPDYVVSIIDKIPPFSER
jgi:hypothetical protein